MRVRGILGLLALVGMVALSALAYASPPDPVWVSGVFDDNDADDVVAYVVSATALVDSFAFHAARPTPVLSDAPVQPPEALPASPVSSFNSVRAPPSS